MGWPVNDTAARALANVQLSKFHVNRTYLVDELVQPIGPYKKTSRPLA